MSDIRKSLGVDIGSVSVKVVLLEDGIITRKAYRRFLGSPFETLRLVLTEEFGDLGQQEISVGHTGIGGKTAQSILGGRFFGEIGCLGAANLHYLPDVRTVIEMGGEDSKLLLLDREKNVVSDFAMNAQCAAGTGSFLDQQAGRLKISIEDEFGRMALKSKNPPRIAGRCSVFAKSDMIHLQQIATPDYDIVAGLCFAVARNFNSTIARGKKLESPIAFEGGVAANPGMVRAFSELLDQAENELVVPEHFNVMGALGAAHMAITEKVEAGRFDPDDITAYLKYRQVADSGRQALVFINPDTKHYGKTLAPRPQDIDGREVYLGIDVGSLSTNLVLIDSDHEVIARRYLMTEGRPIEAVRRGLEEISEEVGDRVKVKAVSTTGSGRYLIGDFVGADIVRNEITAQATAAVSIDPTVDTIFEIGGQDSKFISIDDKAVVDFEMNKVCAAGTGSFLQEQAEKLNIDIEKEFADSALRSSCPVGCGERCTVFMESDLVTHQRAGATVDDLLAGLAYSIVGNYLTKVVGDRRIGDNIFFQGGVAWNKAVVAAFEKLTGKTITVPPHHDVTGAIGAAILAIEQANDPQFQTQFKGFDLHKRKYSVSTFPCEGCSNQCEIRRVDIEGEDPLFYGARCEKYEISTGKKERLPAGYVAKYHRLLFKQYIESEPSSISRGKVGLPRALHFYEYYPFWRAFFESLGFEIITSNESDTRIVEDSLELFVAETCFPIKLAYGHVANLIDQNVDYVFLPSIIRTTDASEEKDCGAFVCPYIQTIGSALKTRFDFDTNGVRLIHPAISLSYDPDDLRTKLRPLISEFKLGGKEFGVAIDAGLKAFKEFKDGCQQEGQKILAELKPEEKVLVVVSRPYNGFDPKLSLQLPSKLRKLRLKAIPIEFLPLDECEEDLSHMYWRYGRRILSAAEYIRKHPNLYAIYISSFGCGPDSFITHFFRKRMAGKPYLQLELDEHSADAGLITRCEAFVDSLRFYKFKPPVTSFRLSSDEFRPFEKTIFIPNMCDHAYAFKAAFERCGLTAEVLEESDELSLEHGKKLTTGKECFPCVVTTGDMVRKIKSPSFDRKRSVFLMPGAGGPCRFGLYRQFHRLVLDDLGYDDIPIFSPNSEDGYDSFGLDGTNFRRAAWSGMVFIDCLIKMLHRTRPYEINKGETEKVYLRSMARMGQAIKNDESLDKLAVDIARDFTKIPVARTNRAVVGVVGEIFLRNNRFSNNHLVEKLEGLGLQVWLASFAEWPLYTSHTYLRDSWIRRDFGGMLRSGTQLVVQSWVERRLINRFSRHFHLGHEYPVRRSMKIATRYLPIDYKGEAILSIGKATEMAWNGAAGIINAMPFNCMPGTVVSSLSKTISDDLEGIPWLNISYEGLHDTGEETRLEAFAEQVRAFAGRTPSPQKVTVKG